MVILLLALGGLFAAMGYFRERREEVILTFDVADGTNLTVYNPAGEVEVSAWDEPRIQVRGLKKTWFGERSLDYVDIDIDEGSEFSIRVEPKYDNEWSMMHLYLTVPRNIKLQKIETDLYPISVIGACGNITLETDVGDIYAENVTVSKAYSANGRVRLRDCAEVWEAKTDSGDIEVEGCEYVDRVRSENGDIEIVSTFGARDVESENGKVTIRLNDLKGRGVEVDTENGDVRIYLRKGLSYSYDLRAAVGEIDFENVFSNFSSNGRHQRVGWVGEGGPTIDVETETGDIYLEETEVLP